MSITKFIYQELSEYLITGFFFLIWLILTILNVIYSPNLEALIKSYQNPVFAYFNYLWIKAIVVDIRRIKTKETDNTMPGFVFWIYGLNFFVFWAINDLIYSTSQMNSLLLYPRHMHIVNLYFTNRALFWLLLDFITTLMLLPFRRYFYIFSQVSTTASFLAIDMFRFLTVFFVAGIIIDLY